MTHHIGSLRIGSLAVAGLLSLSVPALIEPAGAAGVLTVHDLSFDLAHGIALQALETCRQNGNSVTITVVDRANRTLVVLHDEASAVFTVENSFRKAYTARAFKMPSAAYAARYVANPAGVQQVVLANITAQGGGLPIKVGSEVIGAIGVSGSPGSEKDEACAQAGIDKYADQLK